MESVELNRDSSRLCKKKRIEKKKLVKIRSTDRNCNGIKQNGHTLFCIAGRWCYHGGTNV